MTAKSRNIQTWAISALAAALILLSAFQKLSGNPQAAQQFLDWGYSDSFRVFIGVFELLGSVALLIPPIATLGGCGLAVIMLGAVYTNLSHAQAAFAPIPLVLLGMVFYVAHERRSEIGKLFGASSAGRHHA